MTISVPCSHAQGPVDGGGGACQTGGFSIWTRPSRLAMCSVFQDCDYFAEQILHELCLSPNSCANFRTNTQICLCAFLFLCFFQKIVPFKPLKSDKKKAHKPLTRKLLKRRLTPGQPAGLPEENANLCCFGGEHVNFLVQLLTGRLSRVNWPSPEQKMYVYSGHVRPWHCNFGELSALDFWSLLQWIFCFFSAGFLCSLVRTSTQNVEKIAGFLTS